MFKVSYRMIWWATTRYLRHIAEYDFLTNKSGLPASFVLNDNDNDNDNEKVFIAK